MANISKVFAAELEGIDARLIEVETDINTGLHSFTIVGLADKALSEAKERVNSALKNVGVKAPNRENRKIVVNLAPADVKKTGSQYDLAIAVGYLLATKQVKEFDASNKIFVGELSLSGGLRAVNGALSIARLAKKAGFEYLFLPEQNAVEAAMIPGIKVIPITKLGELIEHLEGKLSIVGQPATSISNDPNIQHSVDLSEVRGQENAKRALTIAAAGGHNLLMIGPPGTGKTMLAQALASILPALSLEEVIELTQIYSSAGVLGGLPYISARPFRAPHHTASPVSVIGGGQNPKPGEISLAHRGVLFLDELPEFRRDLLEALRQPLEGGKVSIARAKQSLTFPSKFMLVAAMNPCPCGYHGDPEKECRCSAFEVFRYQKKISGPLLDRIDIQIHVPRMTIKELRATKKKEAEAIKETIVAVREVQRARLADQKIFTNSEMSSKLVDKLVDLDKSGEDFIPMAFDKEMLSTRGYYRVLKVARTIADLEGAKQVTEQHLAEALGYRLQLA